MSEKHRKADNSWHETQGFSLGAVRVFVASIQAESFKGIHHWSLAISSCGRGVQREEKLEMDGTKAFFQDCAGWYFSLIIRCERFDQSSKRFGKVENILKA